MTLTEFLLARIAEDEAAAREASKRRWPDGVLPGAEWTYDGNPSGAFGPSLGQASSYGNGPDGRDGGRFARHIVRWDPARVLTECEAKRRVASALSPLLDEDAEAGDWSERGLAATVTSDVASSVLRLLAQPYAEHPDFDPAWRV